MTFTISMFAKQRDTSFKIYEEIQVDSNTWGYVKPKYVGEREFV